MKNECLNISKASPFKFTFSSIEKVENCDVKGHHIDYFFITFKIPSLQIHQQEGYKGKGDVEETMIFKPMKKPHVKPQIRPMIKAKVMTWPLFKTNLFN
jgi:hypothetical protein